MTRRLVLPFFCLAALPLFGYEVSVETGNVAAGETIVVPISVDTVKGAANVGVRVAYDPQVLVLAEAEEGTLKDVLPDDFVVVKDEEAGNVSVAAFGAGNVKNDIGGTLARLSFTVRDGTKGLYSDITIADVRIGEATGVRDLTVGNAVKTTDGIVWVTEAAAPADPIPDIGENPTAKQVEEALDGSADEKLTECITNAANYKAYREWAESVKGTSGTEAAGAQAVKDSPNAWVSFALGSDKLLEKPPTDEDLTVEEFTPSSEAGKFDFTVSVEGVEVGNDAQKENLKQVFGLEGATSLEPDAFSSGNVDLTFGTPEGGKVKFTAGPKDGEAKTFFMKVKVNP